ncbi:MAG: response regulator [Nitrospiraceae bacterium]|nr:response regulator [Nitrospiraceae bacterium]
MTKQRVLIIDDMASVRKFVKSGLEKNHTSMEIDEASNGKEAQSKLETESFDLIICDWEMPALKGIELLQWVRNHPTLGSTPFIMLTARNDKESVLQAIKEGANAYIVKPFSIELLIQKMSAVDAKFDRRRFERYAVDGEIIMHFSNSVSHGRLLDLSMGGILGLFDRNKSLPNILENVLIDIKTENNLKANGIDGFVIRVQAAQAFIDTDEIKIGVKFLEQLPEEKNKELKQLITAISRLQAM